MSRKHARIAAGALLALTVLLLALAQAFQSDLLGGLGIAALIAMAVVELAFDRCPHCRAYAGRANGPYCSKCAGALDDE